MAAGIFFFDRFLPDIPVSLVFYTLLPFILLIAYLGFIKFGKRNFSLIFGVLVSISFFLFGGILVISERNRIEYNWSDDELVYYGILESSPEIRGKTMCSVVHLSGCVNQCSSLSSHINRDILLYWIGDSTFNNIKCGDKVLFRSRISSPVSDIDFMGFDYRKFLLTRGISGTAFSFPSNIIFEKSDDVSIKTMALRFRDSIVNIYSEWNLSDENRAVISALTIGDKSELTDEMKEVYSVAGTSHVLALSGLHVGILSAILYMLLWPIKKMKYGNILQSVVVVVVLWIFAFVSGLSPSVVRAVTMCSLYLLASILVENGLSGLYSLTLTAFVMLCYQPLYLFDISFQLSFLAVLSIILFFPIINSLFKFNNKIMRYLWGMMAVSISAQLGTLPLILYYFGSFPAYFLLANLIVTPLAVCILSFTLASLILMWIPFVGNLSICALNMSTGMLNASMEYISKLQGAYISSIHINELQMVLMFLFIGCIFIVMRRRNSSVIIAILLISCLFCGVEYYKMKFKEPASLFLAWSDVYFKDGRKNTIIVSHNGICSVNSINIGVMKSDYWKNKVLKEGENPISLDYAYFCRGFKGDLKSLTGIFNIRKIILDPSLSKYYRNKIKKQCLELKIPFYEISKQASYRIVL